MRPSAALLTAGMIVAARSASAQLGSPASGSALTAPVPTLVVLITVDQMREDYFDRFARQLSGGLGRLARGGAFFTNAYQDHAVTETAPGHATTLSGRFPSHTGIVRNDAGVNDPQAPVIGAPDHGASPFRFRGGTLVDWLRVKDPRSRALSVSRKDRGAILPLGRAHQSAFWYDAESGRFTTSTYYADTLPAWVRRFNAARIPAHFAGASWQTLLSAGYPEPDSVAVENGGSGVTFPHALSADTAEAERDLPDYPFMDQVTLEMALAGVRAMELGTGPPTDVLAVSLSSTDAVGHRYGLESRELHDQVLRLDRYLGAFLDTLFALRDSTRVVIALTADHGVAPTPELWATKTGAPTFRVNLDTLAQGVQRALQARGVGTDALTLDGGMLYLDTAALARRGVRADSVANAFAVAVRAVPGVERVDRYSALAGDTLRDPVARRWYHQIPPDGAPALVITLRPYSVWGSYAAGIHGSPYDYDAHVPLIFYGAPFRPGRYGLRARVADLAPTLAWVTGTTPTDTLDGRVRREALR